MLPEELLQRLAELVLARDKPLECTHLVGGKVQVTFTTVEALALHNVAQKYQCNFLVSIHQSGVDVIFEKTTNWKTPDPLIITESWTTELLYLLPTLSSHEIKRSGATRVICYSGVTKITSELVGRILATPRVIDIKFKAGNFLIFIARETAIVGGLAHLAASRKIKQRTLFKQRKKRHRKPTPLLQHATLQASK